MIWRWICSFHVICCSMAWFIDCASDYRVQDEPKFYQPLRHEPLTRYVKLRVVHAPGMSGTFSPPPRVSDSDMHHGTWVTHVPWCMPGSPTSGFLLSRWRENVPGISGACTTHNFTYLVRGPCARIIWKDDYGLLDGGIYIRSFM